MDQKMSKPARGNGTGLGMDMLASFSTREITPPALPYQDPISWLARKANVSIASAGAIAAANAWGAHHG